MANINQIKTIVNEAGKQSMGEKAIGVVSVATLVSFGDEVLSTDTNTDAFTKALWNRIGRTVISSRLYDPDTADTVRHPFEYGLILQKIYVDMPEAQDDNTWSITDSSYQPAYAPVLNLNVRQKLFAKLSVFEIDVTIPDRTLKTAFSSFETMGVLISAMMEAVENRVRVAIEDCVSLTRASFIARKLQAGITNNVPGVHCVNLLGDYNTLNSTTLTVNNCMTDLQFLKYASRQMSLWANRMRKMTKIFNVEGYKRHTPKQDLVIVLLDYFTSAVDSYLQADTFHNELTSLPLYRKVSFWQGSGTSFAFEDISKISIQFDGGTTITKNGIIGVMYDYQALGVTINTRKTTTERNDKDEYTNYYNKVERGYFNDMSENGIVFYLAEMAKP